jgi:hypothetical protein
MTSQGGPDAKTMFKKAQLRYRVKRMRQWWASKEYIKNNVIGGDECGLIAQYGIGDHYYVCSLASAVGQKYGLKVVVAGNPKYAFISQLFLGVTRYLPLPRTLIGYEFGRDEVSIGNLSYAHFKSFGLSRACGYEGFQLIDAYKCLFKLSRDVAIEPAKQPTAIEIGDATRKLRHHGFQEGKTAIICTDAGTTPTGHITREFWLDIANKLRAIRIEPLVNVGPKTSPIDGIRSFDISLNEFRAIALASGSFIGIRSGICDLVANLNNCRKVIFYPEEPFGFGTIYSGANFRKFDNVRFIRECKLQHMTCEDLNSAIDFLRHEK